MERVLSRALLKQAASAFDGWKAWAGAVKARVLRLQKVVFRMQRTKLGAAFFAWVAQAKEARRLAAVAGRVLTRVRQYACARAFDRWVVLLRQRRRMHKALFRLANVRTTRALAAWSAAVSLWKDERRQDILSNSLLRW